MEKNFYEISAGGTMLREGSYLDIQRSLVYRGERADFTPFLNVPLKELEKQLKASKVEEQKIYDQLKEAAEAWDEHGAQTLLLEKAIEYLKVPEVKHTANEWKQQKDGSWEISNLVYKMTFSIVKFGDEWKLTWELSYTAPGIGGTPGPPGSGSSMREARSTRHWRGRKSTSRVNLTSTRTILKPSPHAFPRRPSPFSLSTGNFYRAMRSCVR